MRKTATTLWDPAHHLVSEEDVAAYLVAALADGDPSLICAALEDCMRAMGLASADRGGADSRPLCALSKQRFSSVWDSIENTPEEAANMKLRSALMTALKDYISGTKMSQARAAKLFCVTQPRVSDLMRGKINLFALDELVNMAVASGNIMPDGSAIFRAKTKSILGLAGTLKRPKGKKVSVQDMNAWRRR